MECGRKLLFALVISNLAVACYGSENHRGIRDLTENALIVEASPSKNGALKAGVDTITVTWITNSTTAKTKGDDYKTVKVKLCYSPVSQKDRPWRKTVEDNLAKDKTCQFLITSKSYASEVKNSYTYSITKDIPGATYFVRAYAFDSAGSEKGYGQTSKETNTFIITGISGRTAGIDISAGVFSAFSILSLAYFFYMEKRKAKKAASPGS